MGALFNVADMDNMKLAQKVRHAPQYAKHQILSLKPPREIPTNPYTALRQLNRRQWAFWFIGFLGWTWVAFLCPYYNFRTHLISSQCR